MPRGVKKSTLDTLKQQGVKILASLQREIDAKEKDLSGLKAEADRWRSVLGASGRADGSGAPAKKVRRAKGKRVDWNATYLSLPAVFSAKMVAEMTGKPMEQVYAAVSRWGKEKKVKRGKDGYQKASAGSAAKKK